MQLRRAASTASRRSTGSRSTSSTRRRLGDEIEAIKANKDNTGPQAPDVIDVGLSFGPPAKTDGLIQPYKVSTWDTIPDSAKDADGYWYGDYYGVLSFEVNKDIVKNVADGLGRPARSRTTRTRSRSPATRARRTRRSRPSMPPASSNGGAAGDSASTGPRLLRSSSKPATSCRSSPRPATLAQGKTPILIRWDYNALADRDTLKGNPPIDVVVPTTGVVAGVYVQAISAYAPHPNAAKLWMEYLYSDEGQLGWLKGYCHPIRFNDLAATGKIPADLLAKLPDIHRAPVFPTLDQISAPPRRSPRGWDHGRRDRQVSRAPTGPTATIRRGDRRQRLHADGPGARHRRARAVALRLDAGSGSSRSSSSRRCS